MRESDFACGYAVTSGNGQRRHPTGLLEIEPQRHEDTMAIV
jgi:hypothetical protein